MDDTFVTIIEVDDTLRGIKKYFRQKRQLDLWIDAKFRDNAVQIPYAHGFERKMLKVKGLVMEKQKVLEQNLLPDWVETIAYQKLRFAKQIDQTKRLIAKRVEENTKRGCRWFLLSILMNDSHFFTLRVKASQKSWQGKNIIPLPIPLPL